MIDVLPNPTTGLLKIQTPNDMLLSIKIYNTNGQLILISDNLNLIHEINLAAFAKGFIWFTSCQITDKQQLKKLI